MLKLFKAGWVLIGCQCFNRKNRSKVIPTISFLCIVIVIVVVCLCSHRIRIFLKTLAIIIVIILGVNRHPPFFTEYKTRMLTSKLFPVAKVCLCFDVSSNLTCFFYDSNRYCAIFHFRYDGWHQC